MAMQFTITNILNLFALISPILLGFFLIMGSIFNQNIKGLIYLGGILISAIISLLISNLIGKRPDQNRPTNCDLIQIPFINNLFVCPSFTSVFLGFTIAYLMLPMIYNNQINYILFVTLILLFFIDAISKYLKKCNDLLDITTGGLLGIILGSIQFALLHYSKLDSLLYFDDLVSNNVICERPRKQTFKCAVYKNGELVKNL